MKIGIITAYDESEANSEYSKALKEEFENQGHDVTIFRLPFNIFRSPTQAIQKKADNIIDEICSTIPTLDYVNIQYETCLFGYKRKDITRRIMKIINVCRDGAFSFTLHSRINFKPNKKFFKKLLYALLHKNLTKGVNRIHWACLDAVSKKKGLIITHTIRDKNIILGTFPMANVQAFPLSYKRPENILNLKKNFSSKKYQEEKGLELGDNIKKIGVLGAFTFWKDFETPIKALYYLPENYHLFLYGGQHKLDFENFPKGLDSTQNLLALVEKLSLTKRVHFMGYQPTSADMLNAHLFCDYIVLPYKEVGESGSGSASSALETCQNVFLARNNCFEELKQFCGEAAFNYDMGNYLELAEKIKNLPDKERIYATREKYFQNYNVTKNIEMYLSICNIKENNH